jgi:aldehyde:ferredoxin oxidoreductase
MIGRDKITGEELKNMLDDYYLLRDWDETGMPVRKIN